MTQERRPGPGDFAGHVFTAETVDDAPPRDALAASELRYRRLFEAAKDGIFILDAASGRVVDVNPFLVEMLGYSHDELVGKELWEIGPVRDLEASRAAMRQLQDRGFIRYEDLPLETKDKQRVQVEFVSNLYLVGGVKVIQCNVRDITARKRAEAHTRRVHDELVATVAELTRRDREMSQLNHMNGLLHACATQEEAYQVIALAAAELFPAHGGCLSTFHPWEQRLRTVARWGDGATSTPTFALDDCWAMRRGQPHEVLTPHDGLVCRHFVDPPLGGASCVPLTVHGEALGVLSLLGPASGDPGGRFRLQLAVAMGEGVKLSLANLRLRERLREQATLDVLTGLYNRRFLDESLAREAHRAFRRRSPLCVAMLDLDHFKRFNDTFGHEAGDALLREMGRLLRDNLRRSDISCRYGGEEFVLVLPDSSLEDTCQRVDKLRELVKQFQPRHGDQPLGRVTVSAGVAQASPDGSTPAELLRAADAALYAAKHSGRDRVVAGPSPS